MFLILTKLDIINKVFCVFLVTHILLYEYITENTPDTYFYNINSRKHLLLYFEKIHSSSTL